MTETYHLDSQGRQMFETFNKPALDWMMRLRKARPFDFLMIQNFLSMKNQL
ncbi:hypothetical protein [Streptococcus intermedius]|uniref:hypothetical protein n=1 Tax=Streptococcus intermedius TaxID=1338 RepID=UPI001E29FB15|nr:hypothetical protein [Streptococcus intermedius]